MVAFFPWLQLNTPLTVGGYELFPFQRCPPQAGSAGREQGLLNALMRPYFGRDGRDQIATVLRFQGAPLTQDLAEDQRQELFGFADLLSVAALSNREYFGGTYFNRGSFDLVIQAFTKTPGGAAVSSRRRDGSTKAGYDQRSFRVQRPYHVVQHIPIAPNLALMDGLLTARRCDHWPRLEDAIAYFNLANTDSPVMRESTEIILLLAAIQRLLACGKKEADLAKRFVQALSPSKVIDTGACPRLGGFPKLRNHSHSVRDAWVRDFYHQRGEMAHGKLPAKGASSWVAKEHLLLASFAFPLLLKHELEKLGLYVVTESDRDLIDAFESLASADLFQPSTAHPQRNDWPWNRVLHDIRIRNVRIRLEGDVE